MSKHTRGRLRIVLLSYLTSWGITACSPSPSPQPPGPTPNTGPQFIINSPEANATIAGTTFFSVQPLDSGSAARAQFRAGDKMIGEDTTPKDGLRVFLVSGDLPAGTVQLTATITGTNGGTRSESINVTNVPSPPETGMATTTGLALGTREANGAISVLTLPPGVANGATVSFKARTKAEATALTGVDYDKLGVTFLGAQSISADRKVVGPMNLVSGGFGPAVQPGQAVVQYMIVPDADGDGVGELTVVNTAAVAPNGDVVSSPIPKVVLGSARVYKASLASSIATPMSTAITGPPGARIEIEATGLNEASPTGNQAVWKLSDGQEVVFPIAITSTIKNDGKQSDSEQMFAQVTIPVAKSGAASVYLRNETSGYTSGRISINIEAPLDSLDVKLVIKSAFEPLISRYANSTLPSDVLMANNLRQSLDAIVQLDAKPETRQLARDIASYLYHSNLSGIVSANGGLNGQLQAQAGCIRWDAGWRAAAGTFLSGIAIAVGAIEVPTTGSSAVTFLLGNIGWGLLTDGFTKASEGCPQPPRPPCPPTVSTTVQGTGGAGSAPPPGGPVCGAGLGGTGQSIKASSIRKGATEATQLINPFYVRPGRYIVKFFVNNQAQPFSAQNDAAGYFMVPFVPANQPFTAVAIDRDTKETRVIRGTGRADASFLAFDFMQADTTTNTKPTANAGGNRVLRLGEQATIDGSASSDPDKDPLTYEWALTTRPPTSQASLGSTTFATITFVPDVAGDYTVTLTVSDGQLSDTTTVILTAREVPDVRWDGGGDGTSWNDPRNWDVDEVPRSTDRVTIDVPGNVTVRYTGGTSSVRRLVNRETFVVTSGQLYVGILDGTGALQVEGGEVVLTEPGGTQSGLVSIGGAARFSIASAFTLSGGVAGSGTLQIMGGETRITDGALASTLTLEVNGTLDLSTPQAITVNRFVLSGVLTGSSTVRVQNLEWMHGEMNGTGTTVIPAGGQARISDQNIQRSLNRTLENSGTLTVPSYLMIGNAALRNLAGGTFELQGAANVSASNVTTARIENAGTILKTGEGTAYLYATLSGSGAVTVRQGVLNINGVEYRPN